MKHFFIAAFFGPTPVMKKVFGFDVFLSHSSQDKNIVRELAEKLRNDGLSVWFDEWEIRPGDMIGREIEKGLERSRTMLLFLSRNAFASEWVTLENWTFRFRDPTNTERRFIPVRIDDSPVKDSLRHFAYVDWRAKAEAEYNKLLQVCQKPRRGLVSAPPNTARVRLRSVLRAHRATILCAAVADSGNISVAGTNDGQILVYELHAGSLVRSINSGSNPVKKIAAAAAGHVAVTSGGEKYIQLWDLKTGNLLRTIEQVSHATALAVSNDGKTVVVGGLDGSLSCWDFATGAQRSFVEGRMNGLTEIAATPDCGRVVSAAEDGAVRVWDLREGLQTAVLRDHKKATMSVALTKDGRRAISASYDRTIKVWDIESGRLIATLEGHIGRVTRVAITPDGSRAASGGDDRQICIWDLRNGRLESVLTQHTRPITALALSPDGLRLITGAHDGTVCIWTLPIQDRDRGEEGSRYTNAKVLLVGESGVGKTGLAYRLTEDCFKPSISSDAAWATQLILPHDASHDGIEREIWLWDFAGQSDYRLVHQLYMDETALAVLVFNPQSDNPFEGLGQWVRDLARAARRSFKKLLVAARIDRGGLTISRDSIERFRQENGFSDYIETSALIGTNCAVLREAIVRFIPWDEIPWTASPSIFKLLKTEIIKLKDEGAVLLRGVELEQQLLLRLPGVRFTSDQIRAVVGLLAGPGVVWQLEFGDFVLLQPERINSYASAVIRSVRAHAEEIGCISEEDVLAGRLDYQDMKRLPPNEEQIVLRAMHQTFVDHGLCLREHTEKGTLLIFPSYFKRERPELEGNPLVQMTYQFTGALEEIYATLVVKLHHAAAVQRDRLWRFAADFKTNAGKTLGFKMTRKAEGAGSLDVYFEPGVPEETQVTFVRYIHEHLQRKAQDVVRIRNYTCSNCQTPVENRRAVEKRLSEGKRDIICSVCEQRVQLIDLVEEKFASGESLRKVRLLESKAAIALTAESMELAAEAHTMSVVAEAGQIWRRISEPDWGLDGEIEFRNDDGSASGARIYVQLKSGDSHLVRRKTRKHPAFHIRDPRHAEYWTKQNADVLLLIRTSDGSLHGLNITERLKACEKAGKFPKQVDFDGSPFTVMALLDLRKNVLAAREAPQSAA